MPRRMTISGLVSLILLTTVLSCTPASSGEPAATTELDLEATIEVSAAPTNREAVDLRFTLTNNSATRLYVLKWYTPLEGIAGEIFRVERDGRAIPYQGIRATRTAPSAEDYVRLEPGASASAEVDLATAYDFSPAGTYTIAFLSPRISHGARSEADLAASLDDLGPVRMPSNEVTVRIDNGTEVSPQALTPTPPAPTAASPPTPAIDGPVDAPIPFGLIYQAAGALWHVNVDGEAVKILAGLGDGYAGPAVSPDGTRVVYAAGEDIWLAEIATGERRNLTRTPERRECCAQWWPRRADWILFASWPAEVSGPNMGFATVVRADGTGYQVLDDEEAAFTLPAPGPDGQTVAYDRAGQPWLHRANAGPEPLALDLTAYEPQSDPPMRGVSPAWSPDGTRMAWVVGGDFVALGGWRLGIGVLDLQAGTASLLHPYEPVGRGGWPPAPTWSSDGRWLVFDTWAQDGDETGLWVTRPNGEEEHHLNCGADRTWSPDGRWVACASVPPGHGARLFEAETWETYPLDLPSDARIVAWLDPTSNR